MKTNNSNLSLATDSSTVLLDDNSGLELKLYQLGWEYVEEWNYYHFIHFNKTQDQFSKDIQSLLIKYGNDYLESEEGLISVQGWIEFIAEKLPELGYKRIEPIKATYYEISYLSEFAQESKDWSDVVGEELLQKAIKQNQKIMEELLKK